MTGNDLRIFKRYMSLAEAQVVCGRLQSEGLHPEIKDEHTQSIASHFSLALGSVIVLLPEDEHQKAEDILSNLGNFEPADELNSPEEPISFDYNKLAHRILFNAILGVTVVPVVTTVISLYLIFKYTPAFSKMGYYAKSRILFATLINIAAIGIILYLLEAVKF